MSKDWRDDRVGSALRGENSLVIARMRTGFAVVGHTHHLAGYSLLLSDDPAANHLTDLDWERRRDFLFEGGSANQKGALDAIAHQPFGRVLLILVAI